MNRIQQQIDNTFWFLNQSPDLDNLRERFEFLKSKTNEEIIALLRQNKNKTSYDEEFALNPNDYDHC